MASGDRYVLTIRGTQAGFPAQIENVFAYEQVSGGSGAAALNAAFEDEIGQPIRDILSVAYNMTDFYTINLDDPTDFDVLTLNLPGTQGSDVLPPFMAFAFEYQRTTRAVNNGRKAFSPLSELTVSGGTASPPFVPTLDALAGLLTVSVNDMTTNEWEPRIWKRPGTYSTGVVPAPGIFYSFGNVIYKRVSTQNTRKH